MARSRRADLALVFCGAPVDLGARLTARLRRATEGATPLVVVADAGAVTALAFGLRPDVLVGDLDSLDQATIAHIEAQGTAIERYPRDKDATDGQLACERALAEQPRELLIVGALGGARFDHTLANVLLLTRLRVPATLLDEYHELRLLRDGETHRWAGESGELVSLLPLGAEARAVSTRGLRWALSSDTLFLGDTRGMSNEPSTAGAEVEVTLGSGLLLVARHFPSQRTA